MSRSEGLGVEHSGLDALHPNGQGSTRSLTRSGSQTRRPYRSTVQEMGPAGSHSVMLHAPVPRLQRWSCGHSSKDVHTCPSQRRRWLDAGPTHLSVPGVWQGSSREGNSGSLSAPPVPPSPDPPALLPPALRPPAPLVARPAAPLVPLVPPPPAPPRSAEPPAASAASPASPASPPPKAPPVPPGCPPDAATAPRGGSISSSPRIPRQPPAVTSSTSAERTPRCGGRRRALAANVQRAPWDRRRGEAGTSAFKTRSRRPARRRAPSRVPRRRSRRSAR
jgi:hypothetical protein